MRCVLPESGSDACFTTSTGITDTRSTADVCSTTNIGMRRLGIE